MADKKNSSIEGTWVPLVDSGNRNVPLSDDDLQDMVNNFQPDTAADHIPVRFGRAQSNSPLVAKISALKSEGTVLSGKLTNVDPRFDELMQAGKLGRRNMRSLAFARDPDKGAVLTEMGYMPPRVFHAGAWHDGPSDGAALDDLLGAHREGDCVQFCSSDAGRVEVVTSTQRPRIKRNSERLNERAKARQQERNISFGEALSQVARENPRLTMPDWTSFEMGTQQSASRPPAAESFRFQTNSEALSELAKELAYEKRINFSKALRRVIEENPKLTLPDGVFSFDEGTKPKTNNEKLAELAKARAREKSINYCEALTEVVARHPELTRE